MPRIPTAELERLKQDVSLQRLVEAKGIALTRHGADLIGLCPFHNDTSPSLVVSPTKNLWHCLGACQTGGSVIDWVMKVQGISFRHAVELLRADAPSLVAASGRIAKHSTVVKLAPVLTHDADDHAALREVSDYYHQTLKESPEALDYLAKRGLNSAEMIEHFKLGYANRTLGYRLPTKSREAGATLRGRLQQLGIMRESGHEHFSGSLVIPICDEHGNVVQMYGRKIRDNLRAGTPSHLYLPGSHRGVWNLDAIKVSEEIILCEALIDALTFWCAGFRNVTTSYGIEGFTQHHLEAFKQHGTKRVLIAYDRDNAGEKATAELAPKLIAEGFECLRVQFPHGMDANEYALAAPPADKALRDVVAHAVWLGKAPCPIDPTPLAAKENTLPIAAANVLEPEATQEVAADPDELHLQFGARSWRVRGVQKNTTHDVLRVNLQCREGAAFHLDTLDLYAARQRASFIEQATRELGATQPALKAELGQLLHKLEQLQDQRLQEALKPKDTLPQMTDLERAAALDLLNSPKLLDRILADFNKVGVVGEETNKLVGYIAAVSRKLEAPLAIIIQSSSAAGKSSLMEAILAFMPEEERVKFSAMTGQSLFYMGETNLKHKILAIVEEAGAERAAYALKLLQSEGELTIASTGKDPTSGRLITHEYRVEGPVMIFLTTTAIEIDEELLNRCIVLAVDEEREQTRAIHEKQRESQTLEGLLARAAKSDILKVHRHAQRLLRPLLVANPYARHLTFQDTRTRTRRDHMKYLTLIRAIALLHQYQRPIRTTTHNGQTLQYIEVTKDDVAMANKLAHQVLGRSLDELPPQTHKLLTVLDAMATEAGAKTGLKRRDFRFSRRDVRERTGWSFTQLRAHLDRLVALEFLTVHRGMRGQSFVYELCFDGEPTTKSPHLCGLIDVEAITGTTTTESWRGSRGELAGQNAELAGSKRPQNAPLAGGWRGDSTALPGHSHEALRDFSGNVGKNALIRESAPPSYVVAAVEAR